MHGLIACDRGVYADRGTDAFGLALLPTGWLSEPQNEVNVTRSSAHWSSTLGSSGTPFFLSMDRANQTFALIDFRRDYRPVRCVKAR